MSEAPAPIRRRGRGGFARRLAIALVVTGLFVVGYQWGSQYRSNEAPSPIDGTLIDPPLPLPDVQLTGVSHEPDQPMSLSDMRGEWRLFAIPHPQPEHVSQALERLALAYNGLADRPALRDALRLTLITARAPSEEALAFGRVAPLRLLRGDQEGIETLRARLGLGAASDAEAGPLLLLADPDVRLRAVFSELQAPDSIATDLGNLLEQAGLGGDGGHAR